MTALPANIETFSSAVQQLWAMTNPCQLCPRNCRVYRCKGQTGFCGVTDAPLVSSAGPHFGEETVLVGRGGSGTIFFASCNLGCVFCQNYDISHLRHGRKVTIGELAESMLTLQAHGCSNINLVTPTHVAASIAAAIELARRKDLSLPIVYNTGGYDCLDTLKLLEGFVDIYMPDMKYSDPAVAAEFSGADDYPQINRQAIKEIHHQVGDLKIENGLAVRGLLVRHLVLPNDLAGSFEIIDFLADAVSPNTSINIMDQYRPCYKAFENPRINRRPTAKEVDRARQYAIKKGLNLL
jgi:putative pyruvate formate lyase activating enzyme